MITAPLRQPVRVATRWWKRHMRVRTLVLCYHRVTLLNRDPQLLAVSPKNFDEQMQVLRKFAQPISTSAFDDKHNTNQQVMVTFDDGYNDNLTEAKPILERHNIPATVYVASGFVDQSLEFYWDALETLFFDHVKTPIALRLNSNQSPHEWHVDPQLITSPNWSALDDCPQNSPAWVYREWCELLRPWSAAKRNEAITELARQLKCDVPCRSTHRVTTSEQLQMLDNDLIHVGAHTINHVELAAHSSNEQRHQILGCQRDLEQILNRPITAFSYPYGSRSSFNDQTMSITRQSQFKHAMANFPGINESATDRYRVPRMLVRNWDGDTFERHLREWFDA